MAIDVVILAAGKGTRMKSSLPKVLHPLAGKPLLAHVIDTAKTLPNASISVVIGHGGEQICQAFANHNIQWITQQQQLGTGHAVEQATPFIHDNSVVLILYGDVPLIAPATLARLIEKVSASSLALLTVAMDDPTGYGRILRDQQGAVVAIVEEKDATPEQKLISEVNTGVMALRAEQLKTWLPRLENSNAQGEYYLTDLIAIAAQAGTKIATLQPDHSMETQGVNSRSQLHELERYYQRQQAEKLMAAGVTIADANRFDCRGSLSCGSDCFIDINTLFEGEVVLGANVTIGANCAIKDAVIGDNVVIKANTVIEGPATLEDNVEVGPFARLRPGTLLRRAARIGNFVETKKSDIGAGSKVNHLSYIGDATIGEHANIGAGTITCNYDGVNKFHTQIGDGAFIGSNTALVAPVTVGKNATVGAGSTITRDVGANNLAVARGRQKNLDAWQRPQKLKKD
ncbi:MAG: bifunctional UDP-N-acetylglucosamine diphosphorylase/glucosamine-1-phosphate N-acetyltransferase GlmU [Porticoccaceae bacterium]